MQGTNALQTSGAQPVAPSPRRPARTRQQRGKAGTEKAAQPALGPDPLRGQPAEPTGTLGPETHKRICRKPQIPTLFLYLLLF